MPRLQFLEVKNHVDNVSHLLRLTIDAFKFGFNGVGIDIMKPLDDALERSIDKSERSAQLVVDVDEEIHLFFVVHSFVLFHS